MKKIILGCLLFILLGCDQKPKEYSLDEVITELEVFGVSPYTSLSDLKKAITLKERKPNIYSSNTAPKPYKLFTHYNYNFYDGNLCRVSAIKLYKANERGEAEAFYKQLKSRLEKDHRLFSTQKTDKGEHTAWASPIEKAGVHIFIRHFDDTVIQVSVMAIYVMLKPENSGIDCPN